MKKALCLVLAALMLCTLLCACSKTGDCDLCGKKGVKGNIEEFEGEKVFVCKDCHEEISKLEATASKYAEKIGDLFGND